MQENKFKNNLISLLRQKNLTQKELCTALGIEESVVSRWLTGKTQPTTKSIERIAKFFCVPVSFFYNDNSLVEDSRLSKIVYRLDLLEEKIKRLELEIELLRRK